MPETKRFGTPGATPVPEPANPSVKQPAGQRPGLPPPSPAVVSPIGPSPAQTLPLPSAPLPVQVTPPPDAPAQTRPPEATPSKSSVDKAMERSTGGNKAMERSSGGNRAMERSTGGNKAMERSSGRNKAMERSTAGNTAMERATAGNKAFERASTGGGMAMERHQTQPDADPLVKRVADAVDVASTQPGLVLRAAVHEVRGLPDWGAVGDARRTVMMAAMARESPLAQVHEPPKIEVVQHEMPNDGPPDRRLVLARDPDSSRAAAFRVLRHHILERGQPKVVAVSSPNDREGKTTCAVNLALALAEGGRGRVLLIDGNLRRPELAAVFRFVPPWCFAEQLQVHREQPLLPWGVVEIQNMWLQVAAVSPRRDTSKQPDAPSFGIALERLRLGPYDHIVIDCPAILGSADVNLIQDAADGVLLVARVKRTTVRDIRRAVEQLTPAKVLGTALLE